MPAFDLPCFTLKNQIKMPTEIGDGRSQATSWPELRDPGAPRGVDLGLWNVECGGLQVGKWWRLPLRKQDVVLEAVVESSTRLAAFAHISENCEVTREVERGCENLEWDADWR
jgi:hypothetical protein